MSSSVKEYLWVQSHAKLQEPVQLHGPIPSTVFSSVRENAWVQSSSDTWYNPFNSDVLPVQSESIYEVRAMLSYKDQLTYMVQPLQQWSHLRLKTQNFQETENFPKTQNF